MNTKQVLFAIELLLVVCSVHVQGSVIRGSSVVATSGGINARIENGTIFCDTLTCPPESFKCTVFKNTTRDNVDEVQVTRECFDSAGKSTAQTIEHEPNQQSPGARFQSCITVDKNGNTGSFGNQDTDYQSCDEMKANLDKQMDELNERLQHLFQPGFPFNNWGR